MGANFRDLQTNRLASGARSGLQGCVGRTRVKLVNRHGRTSR